MDRLILAAAALAGVLVSCTPGNRSGYEAWNKDFDHESARFAQSVTALWISNYTEDPETHRFSRTVAWGEIPEKLVPDGQGGYSVVVNLLLQGEDSDGPKPDRFWPVLVRVVQTGGRFSLVSNDALPGTVADWQDPENRTIRFRGERTGPGPSRTFWQFQGRY